MPPATRLIGIVLAAVTFGYILAVITIENAEKLQPEWIRGAA